MKKALIITVIVVVVIVAAYLIRRATTKKFKFVKKGYLYRDAELKEIGEGPIPAGKIFDLNDERYKDVEVKASYEGNLFVLTFKHDDGREEIAYCDKSYVKPVIF